MIRLLWEHVKNIIVGDFNIDVLIKSNIQQKCLDSSVFPEGPRLFFAFQYPEKVKVSAILSHKR